MSKQKFTKKERRIMSEIYRRLNYLHKGNLNENLLILEYPSEVKSLKNKNILIHTFRIERARVLNWYKLTPKGRKIFKNYIEDISEKENLAIFEGKKIVNF